MTISRKWTVRISVFCGVILTTNILYIWAACHGNPNYVFGGILFNPLDGFSYLSKMNQGWYGDWMFTLPYTSANGKGEYLFLFYLFLGHISRWLSLPLPITFHIARVLSSLFLVISLHRLLGLFFENKNTQNWGLIFVVFGSGLGWIGLPFGYVMPDFWVAEIYPFLSIIANPHFPLGLAILVETFIGLIVNTTAPKEKFSLKHLSYGLLLSLILPFGIIQVYIVFFLWGIFLFLGSKKTNDVIYSEKFRSLIPQFFSFFVGSFPVLVYQLWVVRINPLLSIWNQQNQTPSPPFWNLVIALSPALILAFVGVKNAIQHKYLPSILLIIWCVSCITCAYLPFYLQRRFLLGVYIPCVILCIYGIEFLCNWVNQKENGFHRVLVYTIVFLFSIFSNLILQMSTFQAIAKYDKNLYLQVNEYLAITEMDKILPARSVVLASPGTSLFIPAFSSQKVVYGHPYETVNASEEEEFVISFFQTQFPGLIKQKMCNQLTNHGIDFVFMGPREYLLTQVDRGAILSTGLSPVYQNSQVVILSCD